VSTGHGGNGPQPLHSGCLVEVTTDANSIPRASDGLSLLGK